MKNKTLSNIFIVLIFAALAACSPVPLSAPDAVDGTTRDTADIAVSTYEVEGEQAVEAVAEDQAYEVEPEPAPVDNFFEDYGVNPFVDTAEDNLSTFAIDVDTASYSVARRYINDGNLPPADAIRVEEFINYFDQDYPLPPNTAFGIYADGAPSPFHDDGTHLIRIGIQGFDIDEQDRAPASLTFVIDTSGSMDMENRLGLVKQSLNLLVDRLRPDDTVAIVEYGSTARVILPPTSGENRSTILDAIYSVQSNGSTNAEAGLQLGYQLAWETFREGGINRVILCSDGVANVGNTGPDEILETVSQYAQRGITLTSLGFGMGNFNDVLMEQLANDGDGNYAYIDTLDQAKKMFVEDLTSTLQVIAYDAKVQVEFNPEIVDRYRLIGYENRDLADQDFRNDAVDAGEIGAGHSVTALYAVTLHPQANGRIATVNLRWQDAETREPVEIRGDFFTENLMEQFDATSARFQLTAVVAQYAELLRDSPWAQGTTIEDLRLHAERVTEFFPGDADAQEFVWLVQQAYQIMAP